MLFLAFFVKFILFNIFNNKYVLLSVLKVLHHERTFFVLNEFIALTKQLLVNISFKVMNWKNLFRIQNNSFLIPSWGGVHIYNNNLPGKHQTPDKLDTRH